MAELEEISMHPQIANSFIRLMMPRERRFAPRRSWMRWLFGRR